MLKNICWLASYPKSGNTWIRYVLTLAMRGETGIDKVTETIPSFPMMVNLRNGNLKNPTAQETVLAWKKTQSLLVNEAGSSKLILKSHNACATIGGIQFPDERFTHKTVYLIRDPRDVAVSWGVHANKSVQQAELDLVNKNFEIGKDQTGRGIEVLSSWRNHVIGWSNIKCPILLIKYEDLLQEPLRQILRLFNFLEIQPIINPKEIVKISSFQRMQAQEKKVGFNEKRGGNLFFRNGKSGSWKQSGHDFELLTQLAGDVMSDLGYLKDK